MREYDCEFRATKPTQEIARAQLSLASIGHRLQHQVPVASPCRSLIVLKWSMSSMIQLISWRYRTACDKSRCLSSQKDLHVMTPVDSFLDASFKSAMRSMTRLASSCNTAAVAVSQ
jgi:hypothetical protein